MNDKSSAFVVVRLQSKFEVLSDLLDELKLCDLQDRGAVWKMIDGMQRAIDAEIERLVGIYSNPLQQIQEITEEHRNAYVGVVKELINTAPEKMK